MPNDISEAPPRPAQPHGAGEEHTTNDDLRLENEALRRRVAELEVDARRFRAIVEGGVLSVQIFDHSGLTKDVNRGYEALWHLSREDIVDKYCVLEDAQVVEAGVFPFLQRGFSGEAVTLPLIRYDPVQTEGLHTGAVRWVASAFHPVKDESGEVREAVFIHFNCGEIKQSEEELRARQEELERAVSARTRELEESLARLREQQESIRELSTPVIRLWDGILGLPLVGVIDSVRAAQVMENLLEAIVAQRATQVIIDITAVAIVDSCVAAHLMRAVAAAALLGARCILVGISPVMAQTLTRMDIDFGRVTTRATLEEGLREALSQSSYYVTRRGAPTRG